MASGRDPTGATVIRGRLSWWAARHSIATVLLLLGLLAVFGASLVLLVSGSSRVAPAVMPEAQVSPYALPTPTQHPPRGRVDSVHKALHALGRACKTPVTPRDRYVVRQRLDLIEMFATDFPSGGFRIDDESGSTLALLIVIRQELTTCNPSLVPEVEELIPAEYRVS